MNSVGLVVTSTASECGDLLAVRLRALADAGWDARLLCSGKRWKGHGALRDPGLAARVEYTTGRNRYPVPRSLFRRPAQMWRYLRAPGRPEPFDRRLLELRPDLIHFHSGTAARKGMWLGRLLDRRIVVSFREDGGDLESLEPRFPPGWAQKGQRIWDGADLLLFADAAMLESAVADGCPREKAEVLSPPLIDIAPTVGRNVSERRSLRILSAGPLTWEQGFEHSVHAVRLLLEMDIGCDYRILGEGNDLEAVAFARHQLNLVDHVELVPPEGGDSLLEELLAADVFVDPAVTDTTSPTPLLTAQGLGIPFVATGRDGLSEDAGITVPRRSARAIAEGLRRLASDSALRERMGEAGRARTDRHPTLEEHLHRLQDLYRRALGEPSATGGLA